STFPSLDISPEQREIQDDALRVDQSGEITVNWMYRGQVTVLGHDPRVGSLIQETRNQDKRHLEVMNNKLQLQQQVRPTILSDAVKAAGFALRAATALMSKEAAVACTEAVETVIGEHYDNQLKTASHSRHHIQALCPLLREVITEFRRDEWQHLDTAVEHHAQRAPAHTLVGTAVGGGCKITIELCKRF
ncbi:COQ7-domain-containing protein, partial [Rhizopogon salebrosus TDB-379]